jgi:trk system potassium uptake protein TrkH
MNFRYLCRILGMFLVFVSSTMILPLIWSLGAGEKVEARGFAFSLLIGVATGFALYFAGRKARGQDFFRREGLAVVSLGWILAAALGALPYAFCPLFPGTFIDFYFESMSGFTTTGATILSEIEAMPQGILLWRSLTQWLGGMGIIVLFVAVLPALGVEAKHLYKGEVPGIKKAGLRPRIQDTASLLWKIYLGLTAAELALLKLGGMTWFDALNHTFTTLATGGFSTKGASIAHFQSLYIEIVIIAFMFMVGVNFSLYAHAIRGRRVRLFRDTEFRAYLLFLVLACFLLFLSRVSFESGVTTGQSLRESAFQTVSIMTTTGYCTADFDLWSPFARILLFSLMFIGGCAGSTGGSMKVIRVLMLFKFAVREVRKYFFPRQVRALKIGDEVIAENTMNAVAGFFALFIGFFAIGTLIMAMFGMDLITAASSVIATMANVGPGLAGVGPIEHYGHLPQAAKLILSFFMVLGRLEIYAVLALLAPDFWKE